MSRYIKFYVFLLLLYSCATPQFDVYDLRCEYLTEPQGIDNPYSLEQMTNWDYSPRLSWKTKCKQTAYRITVALSEKDLKNGENLLWDSKIIQSAERFCFLPKDIMQSHTKYYWRVKIFTRSDCANATNTTNSANAVTATNTVVINDTKTASSESKISDFSTGLLAQDWKGQFIKHPAAEPKQHIFFKKDFELSAGTVASLKYNPLFVYIASLGYHELYINGKRAGENVLSPAVSRLDKRVLYITYDISKYLKKGKNTLKVYYGAGWTLNNYFSYYGVKQGVLVQAYSANNFELHSDTTWLCAEGNSRNIGHFNFMDMGGELVDGRKSKCEDNNLQWLAASKAELSQQPVLSAQMTDFSKVIEEISAKEITEIADGKGGIIYRVDMGREFTGFIQAKFDKLHCGDTVIIQISMRGVTRTDTARGVSTVQATDTVGDYIIEEQNQREIYIAGGSRDEIFCNRFNYFAGRYIHFRLKPAAGTEAKYDTVAADKIAEPASGTKTKRVPFIALKNIKGLVISSAPEYTAKFTSSNPLYNAVFEMDKYTFQMNHTEGVTTDCPNRERLGYGPEGAYQTAWGLALPCFNSAAYFVKNVRDWADVQRSDGFINNVAPQISDMYGCVLNGTAILNLAWEHYRIYGDKRILEMAFPIGEKWLAFLQKHVKDNMLTRYEKYGYFLGEWVSPGPVFEYGETDEALFNNNCTYLITMDYLLKMADVIKNIPTAKDISSIRSDLQKTRAALHKKYYNAEKGIYLNGDMVRTSWALYSGIVPDILKEQQENHLLNLLQEQGYLNIGSFGRFPFYKTVLNSDKYAETLGKILNKKDYPGYGYFIENGCTTFPEMWEIDCPNSTLIHTSYTGISAFFIKYLAGINEYSCGCDTVIIEPHPISALQHCSAEVETPYGTVKSGWKRENDTVKYFHEVPFGVTAKVVIPDCVL